MDANLAQTAQEAVKKVTDAAAVAKVRVNESCHVI